ncbi:nucleotide exchange factor GrpE [Candidatus Woesebacteria bacterium]|nr:nucleotide exchange factor GrpE [Candidatus Woesebacteria bacterium]
MIAKIKNQKSKTKNEREGEFKNQLARALADYDNLRKRTEAERQVWMKFAKQSLLVKLLPVLDTLEVAQDHLKDKGLEMSIVQFKNILKEEGIEEIKDVAHFDEKIHEAIDMVEGGKKGDIASVTQKGYKFNDGEVIRHAKVRVYEGKEK